ncbi:MAG: segregation and condensation protein A [Sphingomonadaceae bacterium]
MTIVAEPATTDDDRLVVSLESWEGPLDLLLTLARQQKVDLARIPILPLVEQYLAFIASARALRLEIAADYLVMAAWLAYLKSALLLPREAAPDPDPEELAERLRWRLQRLDAMRAAADRLMARDLLGRDVFLRGAPEGLTTLRRSRLEASLYDLLSAYGGLHARQKAMSWTPHDRGRILSLEQALERLSALVGQALDWTDLCRFLPDSDDPLLARSARASSFAAALELTRTGRTELAQAEPFGPLLLRLRPAEGA